MAIDPTEDEHRLLAGGLIADRVAAEVEFAGEREQRLEQHASSVAASAVATVGVFGIVVELVLPAGVGLTDERFAMTSAIVATILLLLAGLISRMVAWPHSVSKASVESLRSLTSGYFDTPERTVSRRFVEADLETIERRRATNSVKARILVTGLVFQILGTASAAVSILLLLG